MAKTPKTNSTNKVLFDTVNDLRKHTNKTGVGLWKAVAAKLSATASQRPEVNLSRIDKNTSEGDVVIVPGKVLGSGSLSKKVTVVGFKASDSAIAKIKAAKGDFIEIRDYISKNPKDKPKILG